MVTRREKYQCPDCQGTDTEQRGRQFRCKSCDTWHPKEKVRIKEMASGAVVVNAVIPRGTYTKEKLAEFLEIDLNIFRIVKVEYGVSHAYRKERKGEWSAKTGRDGKIKVEGWSEDTGNILVVPIMNVKVTLEEKVQELRTEEAVDLILQKLKKKSPKIPKIKYPKAKRDNLLEAFIPDIHFGRSTWADETGVDYDMNIAEKVVMLAMDSILDRVDLSQVGRILFPLGNDFYNVDGADLSTARGTKQSNDPHWRRTFSNGVVLAIRMIDKLRKIAPVDVLMIEGNHDKNSLFYLGTVLQYHFQNNKAVTVDNRPIERKVFRWGRAAIGFMHGDGMKQEKIPNKFNTEFRREFSSAKFKEVHVGHLHHEMITRRVEKRDTWISEESENIFVRHIRALSPIDIWHFNKGFTGASRGSEGFLWNKKSGLLGVFPAIIDDSKYR